MSHTRKDSKKFRIDQREEWSRSPVQRPHSTKKGEKGFNRNKLNHVVRTSDITGIEEYISYKIQE